FSLGWLLSWACTRYKWCIVLIAIAYFLLALFFMSKQEDLTFEGLMRTFVPILIYTLYTLYAAQLIDKQRDLAQSYWWYLIRRLFLFLVLTLAIIWSVISLMKPAFVNEIENYGAGGAKGQSSM